MPARKTKWNENQDQILNDLVAIHGLKKWTHIARIMHKKFKTMKRTGKQCRERWLNHLDEELSPTPWTHQEEQKLVQLFSNPSNRWLDIAKNFPGRSVNAVKNHLYASTRRSMRKMCRFTGTGARVLNAYSIKSAVFSCIFRSEQSNFSLDSSSGLQIGPVTQRTLRKYLIAFMPEDKKLLLKLQKSFSIQEVQVAIQQILDLNQRYENRQQTSQSQFGFTDSDIASQQIEDQQDTSQRPIANTLKTRSSLPGTTLQLIEKQISPNSTRGQVPTEQIFKQKNQVQEQQLFDFDIEQYIFPEQQQSKMIVFKEYRTPAFQNNTQIENYFS